MRRTAKIAPRDASEIRTALKLLNEEIRDNEAFADIVSCTSISELTLEQWARNDDTDPECRAIRGGSGDDTWPRIAIRQCGCIEEWFLTSGLESGVRVSPPPRDPPLGYERLVDRLRAPALGWNIDRPVRVRYRHDGRSMLLYVHSEPPAGIEDNDFVTRDLDALRKAGRLPRDCRLLAALSHRGSLKLRAEQRNREEREREAKKRAEDKRKALAQAEARVAELKAEEKREAEAHEQAVKLARVFRKPQPKETPA